MRPLAELNCNVGKRKNNFPAQSTSYLILQVNVICRNILLKYT